MNIISNYTDDSFYTFETSVIGKEYLKVKKGNSQILIPGFQVELKFDEEDKFFNKEYFLFNKVKSCKVEYSYFDSDVIDEYVINFPLIENNDIRLIEFQSLAFRDNSITFCTFIIEFESLDIYFDKQVYDICDIYVSNLDLIIENNDLLSFLNLKEIDLNANKELQDILSDK